MNPQFGARLSLSSICKTCGEFAAVYENKQDPLNPFVVCHNCEQREDKFPKTPVDEEL